MSKEWLRNIEDFSLTGLDLETHDPFLKDRGKVKARGTSVVFGEGRIIVTGLYSKGKKRCLDGNGGEAVASLYKNPDVVIVGANICYDAIWDLFELGLKPEDIQCHFIDISIVESIIDEYQSYALEDLALKYLNEHKGKDKLEGIAVANRMSGDFRQHLQKLWDLGYEKEVRDYVMSDADQPVRIWEEQKKIIFSKDAAGRDFVDACQMNLDMIPVVLSMKYYGANFDFFTWQKNCEIAGKAYKSLEADYFGKYGEVNINSPKQLAVQFDRFNVNYRNKITVKGWKVEGRKFKNATDAFTGDALYKNKKSLKNVFPGIAIEKGKIVLYVAKRYGERTAKQISDMGYEVTCNPCINKTLFTELKNTVPIVADLAQYKQAKNLVDKFLGPAFGRFIVCHTKDGRRSPVCDEQYNILPVVYEKGVTFVIHGSFNICGARQTGRLSGSSPNLQQVASKTILFAGTDKEIDLARMCRECFIAGKGFFFLKQDYAAQENRLAAHFAPGKNGEHIRKMYRENPYLDEHEYAARVSGLKEEHGEKVGRKLAKNLRFGLSYGMGIPRMMSNFGWEKSFAEDLYKRISDAAPWLFDLMEKIQDTVLKRRFIRTLIGRHIHLRKGHDNEAYAYMNYLIQGSASDMTKLSTVEVYQSQSVERMLLTVHDEDDFAIPCTKAGIDRALKIADLMENTAKVDVPMLSEPEVGTSWADGVEYDPAFGTRREFITSAVKAIKEGRWEEYRKNAKAFLKREDDDDMTFSEFCASVEEDEEEEIGA